MKEEKKYVSFRISIKDLEALEAVAQKRRSNVSQVIREAVARYLDDNQEEQE